MVKVDNIVENLFVKNCFIVSFFTTSYNIVIDRLATLVNCKVLRAELLN